MATDRSTMSGRWPGPRSHSAEWHAASALHRGTMPQIIKGLGPLLVVGHHKPGCRSRRPTRRQLAIEGGGPLGQWGAESALHELRPGGWSALSVNCSGDRQVTAVNHTAQSQPGRSIRQRHQKIACSATTADSPRRMASAIARSPSVGRSRPRRSASVQQILSTLSTPRALNRPRFTASSSRCRPSGSGSCLVRWRPGTSPLVSQGVPASRLACLARASATRPATTADGSDGHFAATFRNALLSGTKA